MGFWGLFSKSDKAVDTGLDLIKRAADGIDALFYTAEEKAGDAMERAKLKMDYAKLNHEFVKSTLNESSTRSYTRRVMAWSVTGLGMFLTLYSILAYTIGAIWEKEAFKDVAMHSLALLKVWWPIIAGIGLFYFGVHILRARSK